MHVGPVFEEEARLAQVLAVVGGKEDDRVVRIVAPIQRVQDQADLIPSR